jgi:hypothetical protein
MNLFGPFKKVLKLRIDEGYKEVETRYISKGANPKEVKELLDLHKKLKDLRRLEPSILNIDSLASGKSWEELKAIIEPLQNKIASPKTKTDLEEVARNSDYTLFRIKTPEEAYLFHGKGKWCISSGTPEKAKEYWDSYTKGPTNEKDGLCNFYIAVKNRNPEPFGALSYLAIQVFKKNAKFPFKVWNGHNEPFEFESYDDLMFQFPLPDFKPEYFDK